MHNGFPPCGLSKTSLTFCYMVKPNPKKKSSKFNKSYKKPKETIIENGVHKVNVDFMQYRIEAHMTFRSSKDC